MKNVAIKYDPITVRWMGYHTALKEFLDKTAMLPDMPKNDENEGKNVKVIYSTPSTAFVKYVVPMLNGRTQYPVVSFYLESETVLNEVGSMFYNVVKYTKDSEGNYTKSTYNQPLIKELNYKCSIYTDKVADCDYILTLLELESNKFKPYSTTVNGRPAQFYIQDIENNTPVDYEGKKLIKTSFTVKVPRAMVMPVEIETDVAKIEKINMYLHGETTTIQDT